MKPEHIIPNLTDPAVIVDDILAHAVVAVMLKNRDIADRMVRALVAMTGQTEQEVRDFILASADEVASLPDPELHEPNAEDCAACPIKDECPDAVLAMDTPPDDFAAFAAQVLADIDALPEVSE
jgi:hypothetical protein